LIKTVDDSPYIEDSKFFKEDSLIEELNDTYLEIASAVNDRTIGLYPSSVAAITGDKWYLGPNNPQQTLRRIYKVSSLAAITHELDTSQIDGFSRLFGTYTNGTNWFGLIPGSSTSIAGNISFYITTTSIVFLAGAGAPSISKGFVVLEWLSLT
jgi:hypothetical protein